VDAYALKRVRRVVMGEMRWSGLLGVFVGERDGRVARGVPERFFSGGVKKKESAAVGVGVK